MLSGEITEENKSWRKELMEVPESFPLSHSFRPLPRVLLGHDGGRPAIDAERVAIVVHHRRVIVCLTQSVDVADLN
jgi:hypothetical protein